MRTPDLFGKYREIINPPYSRKDLITIGATIFILLAIPLTVILINQARSPRSRAAETVKDTVVAAGSSPFSGKMAQNGDVSLLLYRSDTDFNVRAHFSNSLGNTSDFVLPSVSGIGQYILTSANDLWVFTSSNSTPTGPVVLQRFTLSGTPLPTGATLVSTQTFGTSTALVGDIIQLHSGAILASWYDSSYWNSQTGDKDTGFAYMSPSGTWSTVFPVEVDGFAFAAPGIEMTMAQHPTNGSIWTFARGDGANCIAAIHLTETPSGFTVDWTNGSYLGNNPCTDSTPSDLTPEGEFPDIEAVTDPFRNTILLAFEDSHYHFFSTSPFVKGAYVSIAQINADTTKSLFALFPTYVERTSQLGIVPTATSVWLSYHPINTTTMTWNNVYASSYTNGSWGSPIFLGTSYSTEVQGMTYGTGLPTFALKLTDAKLHLFQITTSSDSSPPTISITFPTNGATVSGVVNLTTDETDNVGVTKVEFYVDSVLKSTDTTSPYSFSWDSTTVANGSHTFSAKAYDAAGNVGTSSPISVTVDNPSSKLGDLNGDNKVDIYDLSILLSRWGSADTTADLNKDGKVDIFDLSTLLSKWGS